MFVDLRGSGLSTGQAGDLSFDLVTQDFEAVRRHLAVDRLVVLGHSILGALAIEYARRCPGRVSHVIIVGTPPSGDMAQVVSVSHQHFAAHASPERKRQLEENLTCVGPDADLAQAMFAQTPLRFFDATLDARPLFEGAIARPEIIGHLMGKLAAGWDVREGVPLAVPLLVAMGRHDYVVPWPLWQPVLPSLPTATFELFERSGHQPFVEEPQRFVEVTGDWLRR